MQLFSSTILHHQFLKFDSATVGMGSVLTLICQSVSIINSQIHTHTHPFNGPLSEATWVGQYQKGKTNLDFTEARDSEWQ